MGHRWCVVDPVPLRREGLHADRLRKVADQFPSAEVLGVDLSPIQPSWVPPNLRFLVDDIEDEWVNGDGWDYVHLRCMTAWLKNVPKLFERVLE